MRRCRIDPLLIDRPDTADRDRGRHFAVGFDAVVVRRVRNAANESIEEELRNRVAVELARKLDLPLLATNGVCHLARADREILDAFTCIRHHRVLSTAGRLLTANCERHLEIPGADGRGRSPTLPEAIS